MGFEIKEDALFIRLNKEIYSKEVLFHASYVLLEEFYFFFDIKENYFEIEVRLKSNSSRELLEDAYTRICDELVESAAYLKQLENTKGVREFILEKALLAQNKDTNFEDLQNEINLK